jgi:hypothetical protein
MEHTPVGMMGKFCIPKYFVLIMFVTVLDSLNEYRVISCPVFERAFIPHILDTVDNG